MKKYLAIVAGIIIYSLATSTSTTYRAYANSGSSRWFEAGGYCTSSASIVASYLKSLNHEATCMGDAASATSQSIVNRFDDGYNPYYQPVIRPSNTASDKNVALSLLSPGDIITTDQGVYLAAGVGTLQIMYCDGGHQITRGTIPKENVTQVYRHTENRSYRQYDLRWGSNYYYTKSGGVKRDISYGGCGPTSLAMLLSTQNVRNPSCSSFITPDTVAEYSATNGYANNGTSSDLFSAATNYFSGGAYKTIQWDLSGQAGAQKLAEWFMADSSAGTPSASAVIALVSNGSNGYFTGGGHYIVITGFRSDGQGGGYFFINDPGKSKKNNYASLNTLGGALRNIWSLHYAS